MSWGLECKYRLQSWPIKLILRKMDVTTSTFEIFPWPFPPKKQSWNPAGSFLPMTEQNWAEWGRGHSGNQIWGIGILRVWKSKIVNAFCPRLYANKMTLCFDVIWYMIPSTNQALYSLLLAKFRMTGNAHTGCSITIHK